jgi:hypothetical protein
MTWVLERELESQGCIKGKALAPIKSPLAPRARSNQIDSPAPRRVRAHGAAAGANDSTAARSAGPRAPASTSPHEAVTV